MIRWLPRLVARAPASIRTKLLVAIFSIVVMFVALGGVGLLVLRGADQRAAELVGLQQKIAACRQLQHNTTEQLYALTSALLITDTDRLDATLRQLNQFAYDFDRAQYIAGDDAALIERIESDYAKLLEIGSRIIDLIRSGRSGEAQALQLEQVSPLSDRLKRQTYTLINTAEAQMVSSADLSNRYYRLSQTVLIGIALASIVFALIVDYAIAKSLTDPVERMHDRFDDIAQGKFAGTLDIVNRDELGHLARGLNQMSGELDRLYRQLELASEHKSQFLANMSHELRTPLNAILGYSELIGDGIYGPVPEKIRDVLARVEQNGRHLLGLINAVLDLSKIEAGQLLLTLDDYDMRSLILDAVVSVESLAADKRLALEVDVPAALPRGRGDARRLSQVLLNLVGNALKFTDAGEVRISGSASDGTFRVEVSDTGPGVAPDEQQRIFEEFHQVDNSNTREKSGTGLGLAIARKILRLHGGQIGVTSMPGKGSTFWFTLPVVVEQQADSA